MGVRSCSVVDKPVRAAGREGKLGVVGAPADEAESGHTGEKASTLC